MKHLIHLLIIWLTTWLITNVIKLKKLNSTHLLFFYPPWHLTIILKSVDYIIIWHHWADGRFARSDTCQTGVLPRPLATRTIPLPSNTPCAEWREVGDEATNSYVENKRMDGRKNEWIIRCDEWPSERAMTRFLGRRNRARAGLPRCKCVVSSLSSVS